MRQMGTQYFAGLMDGVVCRVATGHVNTAKYLKKKKIPKRGLCQNLKTTRNYASYRSSIKRNKY